MFGFYGGMSALSITPHFGNRRDGAINPSLRGAVDDIWERYKDEWKRLNEEEGLYVWQVRPSYHFLTVRAEAKNGMPKEEAEAKIRAVLGEQYGPVSVILEKADRGPETRLAEGCCGNQCMGCNNGNPEKRLFILG